MHMPYLHLIIAKEDAPYKVSTGDGYGLHRHGNLLKDAVHDKRPVQGVTLPNINYKPSHSSLQQKIMELCSFLNNDRKGYELHTSQTLSISLHGSCENILEVDVLRSSLFKTKIVKTSVFTSSNIAKSQETMYICVTVILINITHCMDVHYISIYKRVAMT